MGLATSLNIRPLGLAIMPNPKKHGSSERVKSKILGFDNIPNPRKT